VLPEPEKLSTGLSKSEVSAKYDDEKLQTDLDEDGFV